MILITGGGGKTGRAIVARLAARGEPVRALVRRPEQVEPLLELGAAEAVVGDFYDRTALEQAARGVRAVYHICPNVHPDEIVIGELAIAAAKTAGVEHFVYHSVLHPQTEGMPHHWKKLRVEEQLLEVPGLAIPSCSRQPTCKTCWVSGTPSFRMGFTRSRTRSRHAWGW